MENSNFEVNREEKWAINLEGRIVEIPSMVIDEIRARLTHQMGWFSAKLRKAWKLIFPLTSMSATLGFLPLTNPTRGMMTNPWWNFLADTPRPEKERTLVWKTIQQISLILMLCEVNPSESLTAGRMLENQAITTTFFRNQHATKILQVFQPVMEFTIH